MGLVRCHINDYEPGFKGSNPIMVDETRLYHQNKNQDCGTILIEVSFSGNTQTEGTSNLLLTLSFIY